MRRSSKVSSRTPILRRAFFAAAQASHACRCPRCLPCLQRLQRPTHCIDNHFGAPPPDLRNLASATKRLLPIIRTCMQVVVLQPPNLQRERQHGFIGNTIFLPQARPSSVPSSLPPKDVDMQETVLFVLVGGQKGQVRGSALLRAPRDEYTAAVECLRKTSPFYAAVELRQDEDE